jgi:hypothetical protein
MNLRDEDRALEAPPDSPPAPAPTFLYKVRAFVSLFILTIHPAIWNRRRLELIQRENRMRMQMNAMERPPAEGVTDEQAQQEEAKRAEERQQLLEQHRRRPAWVRDYIHRARAGEWVDDL